MVKLTWFVPFFLSLQSLELGRKKTQTQSEVKILVSPETRTFFSFFSMLLGIRPIDKKPNNFSCSEELDRLRQANHCII